MNIVKIDINDEEPYKKHGRLLQKKTRIYFFRTGETWSDLFSRRFTNPSREYRKFLPAVFEKLGMPADTVAKWNIHAGCSTCCCSPGFVVEGHYGKYVFVTINCAETVTA